MLMSHIVLCVVCTDLGGVRTGEPDDGSGFEEFSCTRKGRIKRCRRAVSNERSWRVVSVMEVLLVVAAEEGILGDCAELLGIITMSKDDLKTEHEIVRFHSTQFTKSGIPFLEPPDLDFAWYVKRQRIDDVKMLLSQLSTPSQLTTRAQVKVRRNSLKEVWIAAPETLAQPRKASCPAQHSHNTTAEDALSM